MPKTDSNYLGWRNYATWRVHLEMFDGMETDEPVSPEDLRAMAEDAVEATSGEGFARDYALAFLSDVDWQEIAEHVNEGNADKWTEEDETDPEFVFDPAIHTADAFIPPRSLEIAKTYARFMLEREIGDQDPDPYAGSEWAGGQEG